MFSLTKKLNINHNNKLQQFEERELSNPNKQ